MIGIFAISKCVLLAINSSDPIWTDGWICGLYLGQLIRGGLGKLDKFTLGRATKVIGNGIID